VRRKSGEITLGTAHSDVLRALGNQKSGAVDDHDLQVTYNTTNTEADLNAHDSTNDMYAQRQLERRMSGTDKRRMSGTEQRRMSGTEKGRRGSGIEEETGAVRLQGWVNPESVSSKVKRDAVMAESEFELRTTVAKLEKDDVSQEQAEWMIKVLRKHFLFSSMPTEQLLRVVKHMQKVDCLPGVDLVTQGDTEASDFFIVASGSFEVIVVKREEAKRDRDDEPPEPQAGQPVVVAQLGASACLGEMALLYNSTRTATVRACEPSEVFKLTRAAYQVTLIEGSDTTESDGTSSNDSPEGSLRLPILRGYPWLHDQIRAIHRGRVVSSLSSLLPVFAGDPLLLSGQVGGVLLLVLKGEVQFTGDALKGSRADGVWRASAVGELCTSGTLGPGDAIALGRPGDEAMLATMHAVGTDEVDQPAGTATAMGGQLKLLGGSHHKCAAVALTYVEVMLVSMSELVSLIADSPAVLSSRAGVRAILQNTPWCHDVSRQELDALSFAFKPLEMLEGDVVIEEGSQAPAMHVIVNGALKVSRKKGNRDVLIFKAGSGDVIGERSIASGSPSMAQVSVDVPTVTLSLTREEYASSLPSRMQPRVQKKRYASQISSAGFESLEQLKVIAVVGQGAFARVALVKHKKNKSVYALKKIDRNKVGDGNLRKQLMNERFVMGDMDHPFIAKLHATFKTAKSLFMVLEPCLGGELFLQMQRHDKLPEKDARFYACCVASGLEHLHTRNVVYRDLKPENIMIHTSGYVKIIDFGFAKRVELRTFTLCGTPEYLSPEMVMVRGHGKGVDWWALGVLLYEMVVGGAPHIIHPETKKPQYDMPPQKLYKSILDKNFEIYFPDYMSKELTNAVRSFLNFDALNRLGCLTDGAGDVKSHPFFAAEDWKGLLAQTRPPPFIPKLKSQTDTSNFDEALQDDMFVNEPPYDYSRDEWDRDF
jgi:serine/threonine protein kinase/CRP-like cAMP-binding protein